MRGRKEQLVLFEQELAAARKRIAELEAAPLRDGVTGLPSLQVLWRQLDAEIDRSRRHGRALSVEPLTPEIHSPKNRVRSATVGVG